jgi:hypothetical protein
MNLKHSMELAGRNLLNTLNPEHSLFPDPGYCPAHNTGRWWDAILRLEHATGFVIPGDIEGAMLRNLHRCLDNPDGLLLIPVDLGWRAPRLDLHNLREGLLALTALALYRNDRWAMRRGHILMETVRRALREDGTWDLTRLDYLRHVTSKSIHASGDCDDLTASTGRFLEALVWFYETTHDGLAIELATRIARYHLEHNTAPDGSLPKRVSDPGNIGHNHSYMGTLRGLARYGLLTHQAEYVQRTALTYDNAVRRVVKESGWASHDLGKERFWDRYGNLVPEVACPGDAAQLGMWLALQAGHTRYLDDAERLVRARLLSSQIVAAPEPSGKHDEGGYNHNDGVKAIGAYGGVHITPHGGKTSVIDVTAAVLHSITDIYQHIVTQDSAGCWVHFAFDYDEPPVRVSTVRGDALEVTVACERATDLFIRLPGWAPAESVRLSLNDETVAIDMVGSYAHVSAAHLPGRVTLRYALPERETIETTATGGEYHIHWRGDEIIGIHPNDPYRPFYPTADAEAS